MGVRRVRRYSTEFKLQLVEAYLAGEGSAKGLANQYGISHTLVLIWTDKYRCVFRPMSDTDFGASRTPVSLDVGHLSRGGALDD